MTMNKKTRATHKENNKVGLTSREMNFEISNLSSVSWQPQVDMVFFFAV